MSIRMLIDASHPEETRVAIVDGNRVEDFDYESSSKKQLKGSIYLAKVTRVEPSLQAAFVDYGGNRHGFLAFSEIHPDYYQIPVADREALIAAEAAANAELIEAEEAEEDKPKRKRGRSRKKDDSVETESSKVDTSEETKSDDEVSNETDGGQSEEKDEKPKRRKRRTKAEATKADEVIVDDTPEEENETTSDDVSSEETDEDEDEDDDAEDVTNASTDEEEEERLRIKMAKRLRYKYKIQEVIKKNQIILIQVVKEERGNKGAALTTYLSLPGRYCVLMPNTLHGGGVSRKIANIKDRKKLKNILSSLDMPKGHACIIRTAGNDRTKPEIKRDYDYLKRMWEAIREHTLKSIAPAQIYEEGNLIKRSIRDLYTKDVDEILVEGEEGYNTAKSFMTMLMPSHAKKIIKYENPVPLFQRYQVEAHLDSIYSPTAQLKSGGYIVINPTEALVSIDVNSGRATKEHNIEETAVKTNLEAAEEVARQLKLRDMAGLIVIDFIDMEDNRNNRAVERKMKSCLKSDRARIQVGRISSFGLMEMSRQRLRVGVLESSTTACPHCEGSGLLRSVESQSLHILRVIEEEAIRAKNSRFTVYLPSGVAVYILNNKRNNLIDLEQRYDFNVTISIDNDLTASAYRMDKSGKPSKTSQKRKDSLKLGGDINKLIDVTEEDVSQTDDQNDRPKRRRRRRRGQQNNHHSSSDEQNEVVVNNTEEKVNNTEEKANDNEEKSDENQNRTRRRRRSRRGKRHGQEYNSEENKTNENSEVTSKSEVTEAPKDSTEVPKENNAVNTTDETPQKKPSRRRGSKANNDENVKTPAIEKKEGTEEKPKRTRKPRVSKKTQEDVKPEKEIQKEPEKTPRKSSPVKEEAPKQEPAKPEASKPEEVKPKKKGWWSRS
ncbi:MAG: Rne/Rng family ribonuclease [Emcibacteraceae bacterium]|nr:Rne/Rng family ribonuclease [Emcibacteraceae bacterium]